MNAEASFAALRGISLADRSELADADAKDAPGPGVRLASLRDVDAAHLLLADVDPSRCLFGGTVHLEGVFTFDVAPPAIRRRRWPPVRFTEGHVLAEEHHWRASQPGECWPKRGGPRRRPGRTAATGSGVPGAAQGLRRRKE
ncbi:hypothetical protein [Streptomyces sp. NPDC004250]|uniref:hypothetical protein n=1 Tax=Streptomyces sp. NPDC004250 TaxID=3364692 RepID=UPI0036A27A0C